MTAPLITGFDATISFSENTVNGTPQLLDADVVFTDPESNFDGGYLTLTGLLAEDRVSVRNQGSGAGQIGFDAATGAVSYGGVVIGTLTGGAGTTLKITFNAAATATAIDALIQNLTYANVSDTPTAGRAFTLDVVDATGLGLAASADALTVQTGAANPFNGVDYGGLSNPAFFDYDSDGDLDLVLGGSGTSTLRLFRNDNDANTFTEQAGAANPFAALGQFTNFIAPAFGDIDGDGDKDLVIGADTGANSASVRTFRNDNGVFVELTGAANPFGAAFGDSYPIPAFFDIDRDGDDDVVFGKGDGTFALFRNDNASLSFTRVAQGSNPLGGIDLGSYSAPSFVDIDGDGDLDFVGGKIAAGLAVYRNDNGVFTALTGAANPLSEVTTTDSVPVFADIDGNGAPDLIIGQTDGTLTVYTNGTTITVNVSAQNDAPVNTLPVAQTATEDTALIFSSANGNALRVADGDTATLTVTLTAANGTFTLASLAGLTFTAGDGAADATATFRGTAAALNVALNGLRFDPSANFTGSAALTIRTSDGALVDTDTLAISVDPLNSAPSGQDATRTIDEDGAYVFAAADFALTDSEGHDLASVVITTVPSSGMLLLDGVAVDAGDEITLAQLTTGALTFQPAANANGVAAAGFTFQVRDDGGRLNGGVDLDATAASFTFDITPVDDAPVGADVARTLDEDGRYVLQTTDFAFCDIEGAALAAIVVLSLPASGALLLDGVAVGAGDQIAIAKIAAGDLVYQPGADANGDDLGDFAFQVRGDDGVFDPTANTFTLDVTPVNDAPAGADVVRTTNEDTDYTLLAADFGVTDAESDDLASVLIVGLPTSGALLLNGMAVAAGDEIGAAQIAAGLLTWRPAANVNGAGVGAFTFRLRDDGGTVNGGVDLDQTIRTFTFDVTPVDDAAAAADDTLSAPETAAISGSVFADNGAGADSDIDGLEVTAVNGLRGSVGVQITLASGALLTLNADGTYHYGPNGAFDLAAPGSGGSNLTATDSFTYTLAGGVTATVTITVQGRQGDDLVEGTTANDTLNGGAGADTMRGGLGDDTYTIDRLTDRIVEARAQGADTVFSSVDFSAAEMGVNVETIILTGSARVALGDGYANTLIGNDRNNVLNGYKGADRMEGGRGNDIYTVDNLGDVVVEAVAQGQDLVRSTIDFVLGAHVENLALVGSGDVSATGNDLLNRINGNDGDNVIDGLGGVDVLYGGLGADTFVISDAAHATYGGYDRIMDLSADDTIDLTGVDANSLTDGDQDFVFVTRFSKQAGEMTLTYNAAGSFTQLLGDTDGDGKADFRIWMAGDHSAFENILGAG